LRLVCISDTHCQLNQIELPEGDVLIHAGDATYEGTVSELTEFNDQLAAAKEKYRLGVYFTPGNHDFLFERNEELGREIMTNATVLIHQSAEVGGLKFFMSPYTPWFYDWAFNVNRGFDLANKWADIPTDTEVIVTHGPPYGILDRLLRPRNGEDPNVGCKDLLERIDQLPNLMLSVFGHIHSGYGTVKRDVITFVNASSCNEQYVPENGPIVIDI
jgi:Icc-related predicted phosphoesterase